MLPLWNALMLDEERSLLRKMVKQVIVEMLGSGNCNRTGPASTKPPKNPDEPQLFFDTDYSKADVSADTESSTGSVPSPQASR